MENRCGLAVDGTLTLATGTAEREATLTLRDRWLTGRRSDGEQLTPDDLKLTVNYRDGGKGKWVPRDFLDEEAPVAAWKSSWGERTGNLYLDGQARFAHAAAGYDGGRFSGPKSAAASESLAGTSKRCSVHGQRRNSAE